MDIKKILEGMMKNPVLTVLLMIVVVGGLYLSSVYGSMHYESKTGETTKTVDIGNTNKKSERSEADELRHLQALIDSNLTVANGKYFGIWQTHKQAVQLDEQVNESVYNKKMDKLERAIIGLNIARFAFIPRYERESSSRHPHSKTIQSIMSEIEPCINDIQVLKNN